jgi:hypothetical protein
MTITEKLSHLRAINIGKLFDDILRENKEAILDMNRNQMYDDGIMDVKNPAGKEHYAPSTIKAKKRAPFNKTEFITLKWQGTFHGELELIIFRDKFIIDSKNKIWGSFLETQNRFKSALGLTEENKGELRDIVRDEMIRKIRNVA